MKQIKQVICKLFGHRPYHPRRKHKWHLFCKRCHRELVAHNPDLKITIKTSQTGSATTESWASVGTIRPRVLKKPAFPPITGDEVTPSEEKE